MKLGRSTRAVVHSFTKKKIYIYINKEKGSVGVTEGKIQSWVSPAGANKLKKGHPKENMKTTQTHNKMMQFVAKAHVRSISTTKAFKI